MSYTPVVYEKNGCRIECFVTAKCGSSSIEELFFERLSKSVFNPRVSHLKVLVTRDPWNRLASFYSDKMVNRGYVKVTGNFRVGSESSGWGAGGESIENCSFSEMVRSLKEFQGTLDPHLQPQCEHMQIAAEDISSFDMIISVENLDDGLLLLAEKIGFPSELLSNLSEGVSTKSEKTEECVSNLSVEEHRARGGVPKNYDALYTDELAKIVESIYAEDVKNFGYSWSQHANR